MTFVRCDRWIPGWRERRPADAVRSVVSRYLDTYGPARREEIEHWLALKLPEDALADFEEIDVEGRAAVRRPGYDVPARGGPRRATARGTTTCTSSPATRGIT